MSESDRKSLNIAEDVNKKKLDFDANPDNEQSSSIDQSRRQLAGSEKSEGAQQKQTVGDTKTGQAAIAAASVAGSPIAGQAAKLLGKIRVGKGSGGALAALVIVGFMLFGAGILTTSLGPIAFFTNIMDDLNDQLPAMDKRMQKMMRTKVMTNAEREQFLKGCTKMSMRCKFKSLGTKDIQRFDRAGITVEGDTLAGRMFPKQYRMILDGEERVFTASQLADEVSSRTANPVKAKVRTALNMRSMGFLDKQWLKMLRIVGASKAAAKFTGDVEEDSKAMLQGRADVSTDSTISLGVDEEGNPTVNGETTDEGGVMAANAVAEGAKTGFAKGLTQFAKIFNITGYADIGCSVKNMIGYATTAAKYAKGIKLARYVQPIATLAYKIKAGHGTPHDAAVLGAIMTTPDARETITDISKTFATYQSSSSNLTEESKPNPNFGKNVLDGNLSEMSALKAPPITNEATQKYSLGISLTSLLGSLAFGAAILSALGLSKDTCKLVQNWAARGGAFIVGVLAWFTGYGEANTAANIAIAGAAMAAFVVLGVGLAVITNQNPVPDDIVEKTDEASAAMWTGQAFMAGEAPKLRGMVPGTDEEIMTYAAELRQTNIAYDAIESTDTAWYDTSSPNSLLSKAATTIGGITNPELSGSGAIASAHSLLAGAATSVFYTQTHAAAIDPARLKVCKPEGEIDGYATASVDGKQIALDVQCNVRYHMPAGDLELDVDTVARYMEDNGHVPRDTEDGLPEGYSLPPEDSAQNATVAFLQGTVKGFVDQFYSTRTYGTTDKAAEYGKFLDFCANRVMPWGETFEESSGIGAAEADWVNGKNCMKQGMPYAAFRIYTLDKTVNEISEPGPVAGGTVSTSNLSGGSGTITGDVKDLAQQILDLAKAGKINLVVLKQEDIATRTTPQLQLEDIAAGKIPRSPSRERVDGEFTPPSPIVPDPKILGFLADLGTRYKYTITSLFGQKHSSTSGHYEGTAVDFGCPFNTTIPDAVGKKYGVGHNWEDCSPKYNHYHYEVGVGL